MCVHALHKAAWGVCLVTQAALLAAGREPSVTGGLRCFVPPQPPQLLPQLRRGRPACGDCSDHNACSSSDDDGEGAAAGGAARSATAQPPSFHTDSHTPPSTTVPHAFLSALLFNSPVSGTATAALPAAVEGLLLRPRCDSGDGSTSHAPFPSSSPSTTAGGVVVLSARPLCSAGARLRGPRCADGPPSWFAEVVVAAPSPADGKAWLLGVEAAWAAQGLVEPDRGW